MIISACFYAIGVIGLLHAQGKDDFHRSFLSLPESRARPQFCALHEIDLDQIDFDVRHRQKVRRELLLQLRDRGGLKYREIARLPEFAGVGMNSLGSMYRHERKEKK